MVEHGRAFFRELLERAAEVAQREQVAGQQAGAVRAAVDAAPLGRVAQDQVEDRVQVSLLARHLETAARQLDRGLEQLPPGQSAVPSVHRLEPQNRARDGAGGLADVEDLGRLAVAAETDVDRLHLGSRRDGATESRGGDEEVRHPGGTAVGGKDEGETSRPRAGERALGHPGGKCSRDAGVDGVSTLLEDAGARRGGESVAGCHGALHFWALPADEHGNAAVISKSSLFLY